MAGVGQEKAKLYWYPLFRSARVVWLIKELGVQNDFELIKYKRDDDPAADVVYQRDVHPHGTLPALVIPGEPPLLESGSICMYLADKYKQLLPEEKERRDYYEFIIYAVATLDEVFVFFYYAWLVGTPCTEEKMEKMKKKCDVCMKYLSKRLEGRQFLCGDRFTTADCVLGYDILLGKVLHDGELIANYPKIKEYYERIAARPAFQATINMK